MNHQRREALAQAIASIMRSIDMYDKYLELKRDDIHMMACGVEDECDCSEKVYSSELGKGLEELEALLNNLKMELCE